MNKPKIWLSSPHMGGGELSYVQEAFATNWIAPLGPHVSGFEQELQAYTGAPHVAALSAGTAAIHLALILLGVGAGDEVICSTFTFSASANPIAYQGATPIFVDSEAETWNMDPVLLEQAIADRIAKGKKPKAVILVHLYGMPSKMEEIMEICARYEVPLIEDAAEALGATYRGRQMGTFGLMGVYSFNGNKIITTSGGGALVGQQEEHIQKARFLATQARDNAPHYQHSHIGYNYRMSNVCAGIGRGQLEVLPARIAERRRVHQWYREQLAGVAGISFQEEPEGFFSNRWLTCILLDPALGIDREQLRLAFEAEHIETRPLWKPMHLQPVFAGCPAYVNGTSERLFDQGLCLPSGSNMTEEDFSRISAVLQSVLMATV